MGNHHLTNIISIVAALLVQGCRVDNVNSGMQDELASFTTNLVHEVVNMPVMTLAELDGGKSSHILEEGFEATENGIYLRLKCAADSTWSATNALETDNLHFYAIIKMLPDNDLGLRCWRCTATAEYDESGRYKATLCTESPAEIYWKNNSTATSYSYEMVMDGKFIIETSLGSGRALDCCTITYAASPVSDYSGYDITIVSKR